ncbi:HTH-type transcriptional regulator ZntR [bacterium YEK0313]|nr:HTH-type transcriptional regulator ZntR [bacterium YEK0313]
MERKALMTRNNDDDVFWIEDDAEAAKNGPTVYTIGDLAREFDVTLRALRFYEDKGLLSPRREGLTRLYSATDRIRLQLILKGKRLGFTLAEISEMVEAHERHDAGADQQLKLSREKCLEQIAHLEQQKRDIEDAIAELKRTHETLNAMIDRPK